ncbi:pilus assembly FimT family protein [Pyxidicoccus xibeiensis]|uniref:pilus assembly FimT family protein n=1 Tax=Pyxidicoccus xibeiensis TaxID=2906759 RepID=UPI0020A81A5B|nr:prepilin-type N-terminal cleavage/methylation domain-containing protein [Pyxidicoccus xibeiensis]MCP3136548.1 prepilin-type N-terminal cleavage/methylation domain-containing protein [Pyxidicoccus xibeiensis]
MSMKRDRGMTLIEVMVTVAIAGILIAAALVGMQAPINRQRESAATRELWSSALRARQRAVASNQPVRFVVEVDGQHGNGAPRTVVRWEQLACDNAWSNDSCPRLACVNTTCRADPTCCDQVGEDVIIPETMSAAEMQGLCYLPGSGRPVQPNNPPLLGCMQGQLDNTAALTAAAPGNLRFTFTSERARSLLIVEPVTGLSRILDCDSQAAIDRPVTECTN